ncbi:hypothetical protein [Achromobacter insolitus]|nr:hypothetical protein [Achromobacter insolitus]
MSNLTDGWQALCHILGTEGRLRMLCVRASTLQEQWPVVDFEYFEGGLSLRYVRAIQDDSKGDFFKMGQPIPAEDLGRSNLSRTRHWLTLQDISDIATRLGWPISKAAFWTSPQAALRLQLTPRVSFR